MFALSPLYQSSERFLTLNNSFCRKKFSCISATTNHLRFFFFFGLIMRKRLYSLAFHLQSIWARVKRKSVWSCKSAFRTSEFQPGLLSPEKILHLLISVDCLPLNCCHSVNNREVGFVLFLSISSEHIATNLLPSQLFSVVAPSRLILKQHKFFLKHFLCPKFSCKLLEILMQRSHLRFLVAKVFPQHSNFHSQLLTVFLFTIHIYTYSGD